MKNVIKTLAGIVIALILGACNNFFHDLIPPDDTLILSFYVDGQLGAANISDNSVIATVAKGSSVHELVPSITVSNKAVLIPVTLDYVKAAFPSADLVEVAMTMSRSTDLTSSVIDLIKEYPDFNVPALDIPIDFSGPVTMIVVGGQGSIRQYTVNVVNDSGEPRLLNMRFSKYDNPELVYDALCVYESGMYVTMALYPAEMREELSFALIPSFEILGDKLEITSGRWDPEPGTKEIISGVTPVLFDKGFGNWGTVKTITVTRDGVTVDYTLAVIFREDPDSIRSITDFRFTSADNSGLAANAVGSIINTDNTGTINVQVLYSGTKPTTLIPRFISPGTVSVEGVTQTTGVNSHDFSAPVEYKVVSKNGLYMRIYTVKTEFINVASLTPRITSFRLSAALNPELVQDAEGKISDGLILIDAYYGSDSTPTKLAPEFTADGIVRVNGSVQVSGASGQDFNRKIKYTVSNPLYPEITMDYWVECRMVADASSYAAITSFSFLPGHNAELSEEVTGKIDQITGKIAINPPVGSGVSTKTMFPSFTASGQVFVEETPQVSGSSGRIFSSPVTYKVVSPNGKNTRVYTVIVKELKSPVYVNCNANGMNDGTSWEDAFISLKAACDATIDYPETFAREIWIAKGVYKPGETAEEYFPLISNTSYIGGFAGYETSKTQRNVSANTVTISGDLGGGEYSHHLFAPAAFEAVEELSVEYLFEDFVQITKQYRPIAAKGNVSFEDLNFTSARAQNATRWKGNTDTSYYSSNYDTGGAINTALDGTLTINKCNFTNLQASSQGGAIFVRNGTVKITDSNFNFIGLVGASYAAGRSGAIYFNGSGNAEISNTVFDTIYFHHGAAVYSSGYNIVINNIVIKNCNGHCGMIYLQNGNLTINDSEIFGNTIENIVGGSVAMYRGTFTMNSGTISNNVSTGGDNGGGVSVHSGATFIMNGGTISGNTTKNGGGVSVSNGTFTMKGGTISGNTASENGGGVVVSNDGIFNLQGGTISGNTATKSGGGVCVQDGTFNLQSGTISGNTSGTSGGGVSVSEREVTTYEQVDGTFTMNGGNITSNSARENGGGVYVVASGIFKKTGGTITGYETSTNGNVVKNASNVVQSNKGHTAYVASSPLKRREITAATNNDLDSDVDGAAGGWWEPPPPPGP